MTKERTTINNILHRKLKIEQREPHLSTGWTLVHQKG